jgi:hypothetical protein
MTEQDAVGLNRSEAAVVVAELRDYESMSFSEIAQCVPRSRSWIEDRYEEHGGFDVAE